MILTAHFLSVRPGNPLDAQLFYDTFAIFLTIKSSQRQPYISLNISVAVGMTAASSFTAVIPLCLTLSPHKETHEL
jgi:hypothetical protein